MLRKNLSLILSPLLLLIALCARADVTIEVTGVGAQQFPIAVANFVGEAGLADPMSPIVRADLARSGRFKLIDPSGATLSTDAAPPALDSWKTRGADSLATGDVKLAADGSAVLRLRLYDTATLKQLAGVEIHAGGDDLRRAAHQAANVIYEALTGEPGVFDTRIAFVVKRGSRYDLQVADADGYNPQTVIGSNEPIISPTWALDGKRLAYVSFERQKPIVFVQDVFAGTRRAVAAFKGSNSAPSFSPDGKTLAVTLTLSDASQVYLIDAVGGKPRRLMSSPDIDTEANYSPDGNNLVFTSDRGGSPQLYEVSSLGGDAQRLTFDGNYNVSPHFSADGKTIVYVRRDDSGLKVATLDVASRQTTVLTDGPSDESPTFAPNGRMILYATEVGGRGVLATVSSDGRVKQRLSTQGDVRDPAWGPSPSQLPMIRLSSNP